MPGKVVDTLLNILDGSFADVRANIKLATKEKTEVPQELQFPASLIGILKEPGVDVGPTLKPLMSLKEVLDRSFTLNAKHCRFFLNDIIRGIGYLHAIGIVHGHLSLCNLQLNHQMRVIISGGVTKWWRHFPAPELYKGQDKPCVKSDVWAIGAIMYSLLLGKGPFDECPTDAKSFRTVFALFSIPAHTPIEAATMIRSAMAEVKADRPSALGLLSCEFMTMRAIPRTFAALCTLDAEFDFTSILQLYAEHNCRLHRYWNGELYNVWPWLKAMNGPAGDELIELHRQLELVMGQAPTCSEDVAAMAAAEDVNEPPTFWVDQCAYYVTKHTLYYHYVVGDHGAIFRDGTQIVVHRNLYSLKYIDEQGQASATNFVKVNKTLLRKLKLVFRFGFIERGKNLPSYVSWVDYIDMLEFPHVRTWVQNKHFMVLHLTNGVIQFIWNDTKNFIFDPGMKTLTYCYCVSKAPLTFHFETLIEKGLGSNMIEPLQAILAMLRRMVNVVKKYRDVNPGEAVKAGPSKVVVNNL